MSTGWGSLCWQKKLLFFTRDFFFKKNIFGDLEWILSSPLLVDFADDGVWGRMSIHFSEFILRHTNELLNFGGNLSWTYFVEKKSDLECFFRWWNLIEYPPFFGVIAFGNHMSLNWIGSRRLVLNLNTRFFFLRNRLQKLLGFSIVCCLEVMRL